MTTLRRFFAFLYDFIVGDDPLIAFVVVLALALTAAIASSTPSAWWVLPASVVLVLAVSLLRATGSRGS